MQQNTFSARLASKVNALYRKIFDHRLEYAGILSDVIRVKVERTTTLDIASREVTGLDLINVIFPRMEDIPMRKVTNESGDTRNAIYANANQPFMLFSPVTDAVDIDDLLIKLYEDTTADMTPWVTVFQVKDLLGTFGDRSIVYQKIQCSYFDESLPPAVITYITDMAARREEGILGW
jgi:hypothetical protein